jgi:hypothetical protein
VPENVRECLGDDEVSGGLKRTRKSFACHVERHLQADARRERFDPRAEAACGERTRQNPVYEFAQLVSGLLGLRKRIVHEFYDRACGCAELVTRQLQRNYGANEALLRAVVEVTLDTLAHFVGGRQDRGTGCGDLRVRRLDLE